MSGRPPTRRPSLLGATALALLVCVIYLPILDSEFIKLDVNMQVVENAHIRGITFENVKHILSSLCVASYYPVRTLSYALDYQIWGLNSRGFKLSNGLIHLSNVLLLFWLLLRLFRHRVEALSAVRPWWDVGAATFSAGIFAVHPVVVEPVTWVAGREELLMMLGVLGCMHFHLLARRLGEEGGRSRQAIASYAAAAVCCAAACLSNAAGAVIPLVVTAWDLLTIPRPKLRKVFWGTSGLWLVGVAAIVIKRYFDPVQIAGRTGRVFLHWVLLPPTIYWLDLETFFWPTRLGLNYEKLYRQSFLDKDVILGTIAIGLSFAALWILRRRKMMLLGLFWFGFALAPALQIMPHPMTRPDRLMYFPLAGLVVVVAGGSRWLGYVLKSQAARAVVVAAGVLGLVALSTLSTGQVQTWQDELTVWENAVKVSPQSATAHCHLANKLAEMEDFDRAFKHYDTALYLDPNNANALDCYALELAACKDQEKRNYRSAIAMSRGSCQLTEWKDQRYRHTLSQVYNNYAVDLGARGEVADAVRGYRKAMEADPAYVAPAFNLALLLATCKDEKLQDPDEAVRLAERACQIAPSDPNGLWILALAYDAAGRPDESVAATKWALRLAEATNHAGLTEKLRHQLLLLRTRASAETSSR